MEYTIDILLLVLCSVIDDFVLCELVLRGPEDNCRLWTPPTFNNLTDNDRVDVGSQSSLIPVRPVQIGVYVLHTQWMIYEGCTLHLYDGPCTHRLSGQTDPIIECYEHCNKTTFSLFDKCCYCQEFSTIAKNMCTAKQCFPTYNGICGETFIHPNVGCFCQYRPIELSVRGGPFNCLSEFHTQGQDVRLQSISCKSSLRYVGVSGVLNTEYHKESWWTAATKVQNKKSFFANETYLEKSVRLKGNTWYWIGIFRKQKLLPERPTGAEFCGMLIKDGEGTVIFKIKECNDSLSKLCEINDTSPTVPQTTVSVSGTKTVPTDSRPEVGTKTKVDNEPDVDENPEVDNKPPDANNGISTGVIIPIVTLIVSLIIVLFIVLAIVKRKAKSSVMDANVSNENSPPLGNVYNSLIDIGQSRGGDDYSQLNTEDQRVSNENPPVLGNVYDSLINIGRSRDDDYSQLNTEDQRVVYHEIRDNTDQNNYDDVN